jgi:hypothetical protein
MHLLESIEEADRHTCTESEMKYIIILTEALSLARIFEKLLLLSSIFTHQDKELRALSDAYGTKD